MSLRRITPPVRSTRRRPVACAARPAALAAALLAASCNDRNSSAPDPARSRQTLGENSTQSLLEARKGFATKLLRTESTGEPAAAPESADLKLVSYHSPIGDMAAYISPSPAAGKKHPAIIWLIGGFSNSIGSFLSAGGEPENDQSAISFRKAGVVTLYPSLRGGNANPGHKEGFYGEVDDVLAAAEYLRKVEYVDPARIYLGGHSTGGTLALLVAETGTSFRAVFSFGPVEDVTGYGPELLPFDIRSSRERDLRMPSRWLGAIRSRTFVFEGNSGRGNIDSLRELKKASHNPLLSFHPLAGDHFSILQPLSRLIATKILADQSPDVSLKFTAEELSGAVKKWNP